MDKVSLSYYVEGLASVVGHGDKAGPLRDYCLGVGTKSCALAIIKIQKDLLEPNILQHTLEFLGGLVIKI